MFPMPQPAALLATAIQRLLAEHVEHPLRHLHERSLHARLGHLLPVGEHRDAVDGIAAGARRQPDGDDDRPRLDAVAGHGLSP